MLNLYTAQIESISLHRVGNKSKNEAAFMSAEPFSLNDEMAGLLDDAAEALWETIIPVQK